MLNSAGNAGDLVIETPTRVPQATSSVVYVLSSCGEEVGTGEGACPSPEYRNKYSVTKFVPTQHPILLLVPIIYYAITISTWYTTIVFSQLCVACVIGSL